ncbi:MAG: bifunctional precorrin-2 dehydrogenase/sirohydrochlorin ferrochelatase [Deltaproteobacteria bacterium]|nr:bifunctional precorrin-2 dehydrogenase/sirohydrochlorin ferrochelatase [Deltaproteobacteria bacterium]
MRYYPVFLDIKGKPCVIVGGGEVAERKALSLLSAGASVKVISPNATKTLNTLVKEGSIERLRRKYKKGDLNGAVLAISASDSKEVNKAVYEEAQEARIPVNVVDDPAHCGFIVPSVVQRGGLTIAISTGGRSPLLAKTIRQELEKSYGEEYETFVEVLGAVRKKLLKSGVNRVKKERVIKDLIASPMPGWIKENADREINSFLKGLLGQGYSLSSLGVKLKDKDKK